MKDCIEYHVTPYFEAFTSQNSISTPEWLLPCPHLHARGTLASPTHSDGNGKWSHWIIPGFPTGEFPTGQCFLHNGFLQDKVSYMMVSYRTRFPTGQCFLQDNVSYRTMFPTWWVPTGQGFLQDKVSYRTMCPTWWVPTGQGFLQDKVSYRTMCPTWWFPTGQGFLHDGFLQDKVSYRTMFPTWWVPTGQCFLHDGFLQDKVSYRTRFPTGQCVLHDGFLQDNVSYMMGSYRTRFPTWWFPTGQCVLHDGFLHDGFLQDKVSYRTMFPTWWFPTGQGFLQDNVCYMGSKVPTQEDFPCTWHRGRLHRVLRRLLGHHLSGYLGAGLCTPTPRIHQVAPPPLPAVTSSGLRSWCDNQSLYPSPRSPERYDSAAILSVRDPLPHQPPPTCRLSGSRSGVISRMHDTVQ